ncbi:MAG: hypothetical protein H0T55_01655 [Rubrobacteraceae bacterium]|nr:hypothetical protein [Rubrobacteraceae bacterium]MDQ3250924.1 hypothetical protein [Actinomycetota bacterium]MDQ3438465.1 hypothetical protein [Actinomycetota bacterium]
MAQSVKKTGGYEAFDIVHLPEAVPDAGLEAGQPAVVDSVYDDGRGNTMLLAEISRQHEDPTVVLLDIEVKDDGTLKIVSYSTMSA